MIDLVFYIVTTISGILSALFWYRSTKGRYPKAPKAGDTISAKPFQDLFKSLEKQGKENKKAAYGACGVVILQVIQFTYDKSNEIGAGAKAMWNVVKNFF